MKTIKPIDYLVVGLLTTCLAVLTNDLVSCHFFDAYDKLLLTALWSAWLIVMFYYYMTITKNQRFSHTANGGWMLGLAVALQNDKYTKGISFIIPFIVLEIKWTKAN